jgi:hypothetical protein
MVPLNYGKKFAGQKIYRKLYLRPIDDIQDQNDDANRCRDCHYRYGTDMNSPPVLALIIVDETR